ncbi:MAG: mandelate racemase/muconate lactonizing enzyme family protein [Povalibacter sp.]
MQIVDFRITRFQFARDRVIGDSQVRADDVHLATIELVGEGGDTGLGFMQSLFHPLPAEKEIERVFREECWPSIEGREVEALAHAVRRPRGGNVRKMTLPFEECLQHAVWDLFAKSLGMPLWKLLGAEQQNVEAYASGLDFHLSDSDFEQLFAQAAAQGFRAFKIKVGHPEIERDLHRLSLLKRVIGPKALVMVDANEAWTPKQAIRNLTLMQRAGHEIYWVEDPILRDDFAGLKLIQDQCGPTLVNAGEYLDVTGKRKLLEARVCDLLNVHGHVTDVMRIGWLAADMGAKITMGNTFLELGVNMALALPGVEWLEYSFQNFEHLVEQPYEIRDGRIYGSEQPGHGLMISEIARRAWRRPEVLPRNELGHEPPQQRLQTAAR